MRIDSITCVTLLVSSLLLFATPASVAGQPVARSFAELGAESLRGNIVSVTGPAGAQLHGRILDISDASVTLLVDDAIRELLESDVAWITRRRRHAGRGALVGLVAGASIGLIEGFYDGSCTARSVPGCRRDDIEMTMFLAGILGGFFSGVGAGIGATITSKEILYAAPPRAISRLLVPYGGPGVIGVRAQLGF
jgi:hypothetical protein